MTDEKYTGDFGKLITDNEDIGSLTLGSIIRVVWSEKEEYIGVIFCNKIGYKDGLTDDIHTIVDSMNRDLCKVYVLQYGLWTNPIFDVNK